MQLSSIRTQVYAPLVPTNLKVVSLQVSHDILVVSVNVSKYLQLFYKDFSLKLVFTSIHFFPYLSGRNFASTLHDIHFADPSVFLKSTSLQYKVFVISES